jgi:uncharacterized coiled-coil protein SlyX
MAERVEERLSDLERLVVRQAERIEDLEEQLNALMRMAHQTAMRVRPRENEAA